jgi:hypothetical protein
MMNLTNHDDVTALTKLDGRAKVARVLEQQARAAAPVADSKSVIYAGLAEMIGPNPTAVQRMLAELALSIGGQLAALDFRSTAAGGLDEKCSNRYLSLHNSLQTAFKAIAASAQGGIVPHLAEMPRLRRRDREKLRDAARAAAAATNGSGSDEHAPS